MEEKTTLYIVYSNNSKKSRLKRSKKYKRVWDAEKQKYVKVKKTKKRIAMTSKELKEFFAAPVENKETSTKPAEKKEMKISRQKKQKPESKEKAVVTTILQDAIRETLTGKQLVWDNTTKRYVAAA